jgi:radical SAM superfamily enzyme YgiQ (UPF0313 family)
LADDLAAIEPPTWLRMNAGWLRDRGYNVAIIDQDAMRWTAPQVAERIEELNPRLAAIVVAGQQPSASTQQMTGATMLADAIVAINPDRAQVVLGHHASALPERTLREMPVAYVCDGEGPLTLAGLLDGLPNADIPGLVWWDGERVKRNALAPPVSIDDLGGDVWNTLPMGRYRAHTWQVMDGSSRQPYASVYTTLGCMHRCSFCMINVFQHTNKYRMRSPALVLEQIRRLHDDHGVRTIKIADEMFVAAERHYVPICEGLAALPFAHELNIWAYARVDTIKAGHLPLLRRAGIRWLALGIESGSAYVRSGADKSLDDDDIHGIVRAIQAAGIFVVGNFIVGLGGDTRETMRATVDLAKSLQCEWSNIYSCMAYPGSRLFEEARPEDLPDSWAGYSQHAYETRPLPTATLSSAEVLAFRDAAFIEIFTDPAYLDMIERKFSFAARTGIERMVAHRLPRKLLESVAA